MQLESAWGATVGLGDGLPGGVVGPMMGGSPPLARNRMAIGQRTNHRHPVGRRAGDVLNPLAHKVSAHHVQMPQARRGEVPGDPAHPADRVVEAGDSLPAIQRAAERLLRDVLQSRTLEAPSSTSIAASSGWLNLPHLMIG